MTAHPGFVDDAIIALAAAMLLKTSLIFSLAFIASKIVGSHAARAATVWRVAFLAAVAVPILSSALPSLNMPSIDLRHDGFANGSLQWIVVVWIVGILVGLTRLIVDCEAARRLARRADTVTDPRLIALLNRAIRITGCHRCPKLKETGELRDAAATGWRNPTVILPLYAHRWSDNELLGVLCHELEHLRHGDWAALIFERIAVVLFWMNPMFHLAFHSSCLSREVVADDAAVRGAVPLDVYALRLIASARHSVTGHRLAASLAFGGRGNTRIRVRAIFEIRRRRPVTRQAQICLATFAVPLIIALSAVEPWRCIPGTAAAAATSSCP
jgi:beta-lactamase regulating signal transducer with metallopeptidase domain